MLFDNRGRIPKSKHRQPTTRISQKSVARLWNCRIARVGPGALVAQNATSSSLGARSWGAISVNDGVYVALELPGKANRCEWMQSASIRLILKESSIR